MQCGSGYLGNVSRLEYECCVNNISSKELVLRFNLGPLHLLNGLIDEVLALGTTKSYLRQAIYIGKTVTKDLKKSATIGSFQKKNETKSRFPLSFWLSSTSK